MTGELTLFVLRLAFLAVLWIFVFSVIYALRSDLFGTRAGEYRMRVEQSRQQTFGAAEEASPRPEPVMAAAAGAREPSRPAAPPPAAGRPSRLVITSGPRRGTEIPLAAEPLSIGRARDSGLVIQDDYTSTRHARLLLWDEQWMIQDLDSTNGTFVAGERVDQPTPLHAGTPVRIGTTTFELR
ncbi:MAG: FHA domain-containing protein [Pseudoclavibacter sp.]|nr:FHA domain-containing protein [Pseudoclavibacter sp.]